MLDAKSKAAKPIASVHARRRVGGMRAWAAWPTGASICSGLMAFRGLSIFRWPSPVARRASRARPHARPDPRRRPRTRAGAPAMQTGPGPESSLCHATALKAITDTIIIYHKMPIPLNHRIACIPGAAISPTSVCARRRGQMTQQQTIDCEERYIK